jgi:hypothetical protein
MSETVVTSPAVSSVRSVVRGLFPSPDKSTAEGLAPPCGRNQNLCVPLRPPRLIVHSTAEDAEVRRESCKKPRNDDCALPRGAEGRARRRDGHKQHG